MKSIKNFEGKKVLNMSNIEGGQKIKTSNDVNGTKDKYDTKTGLYISNTGWFDGPRD